MVMVMISWCHSCRTTTSSTEMKAPLRCGNDLEWKPGPEQRPDVPTHDRAQEDVNVVKLLHLATGDIGPDGTLRRSRLRTDLVMAKFAL